MLAAFIALEIFLSAGVGRRAKNDIRQKETLYVVAKRLSKTMSGLVSERSTLFPFIYSGCSQGLYGLPSLRA